MRRSSFRACRWAWGGRFPSSAIDELFGFGVVGLGVGVVGGQGHARCPAGPGGVGRRHRQAQAGHAGLDAADDRLDHLDPPVALVLGRDHVPGGQRAVGQAQHVVDRLGVLGPLLAVAPVLLGQLPGLERVVPAAFEAAQLLLVREVHPELDHDHALFGQGVFEVVDLVVGPAPLLLGGQLLHPLDQDPAVPAAVEDGHAAPTGQRAARSATGSGGATRRGWGRRRGRCGRGADRAARPAA